MEQSGASGKFVSLRPCNLPVVPLYEHRYSLKSTYLYLERALATNSEARAPVPPGTYVAESTLPFFIKIVFTLNISTVVYLCTLMLNNLSKILALFFKFRNYFFFWQILLFRDF